MFIFEFDKEANLEFFHSVLPLSIYFIKKGTAILKNRTLFFISLNLKYSNCQLSDSERFFFKLNNTFYEFLKKINYQVDFNEFSNKYKFIKDIGEGRYGKVFLFEKIGNDEKVAIKKISKRKPETNIERLLNEIDILKFIKDNPSENIVKVENIIEDYDTFYIVMEYLPFNLSSYLSKNIHNCNKNQITKQIVNGLKFLHSNGILHREIKTENILIENEMNVKITDFGFSKVLFKHEFTNEPCGTLPYSAPELLYKHFYNYKVDFWSFGVLTYLIYYNTHPYENELKVLSLEKLINFIKLEFSIAFSETVHPGINLIIKECFAKDPLFRIDANKLFTIMNTINL